LVIDMIEDLKGDESWRMFRIISEFTEGFDKLSDLGFAISIFGSARTRVGDDAYQAAVELADRLAKQGFSIITGGGPGMMEAGNKGAYPNDLIKSVGLNIELPHEQMANPFQDISLHYRHFFARKVMFVKHSMGYVCMPGGFGTLDELLEALTLMQTQKIYPLPLVLFGVDYWQGLIDWMRSSPLSSGNISESDLDYITLTDDIDETVEIMCRHRQWKEEQINKAHH
jgi:uncharacterized protein (TIGR00730 family)